MHTPPPFNRNPTIDTNIAIAIITPKNFANPSKISNEIPMKRVTYYSITTSTILYKTKY